MSRAAWFIGSALLGGLLILMPIYLSALLLLKATQSVARVVPLAKLLPEWLPAEGVLSLFLVLIVCFLVGIAVRTPAGRGLRERIEKALFDRLPGYALFRGLTQQMGGTREEHVWKPAMAEIEDALVPAFIIEKFDDGRFIVFVPSAPMPLSGAVYVLSAERVHPLDVPSPARSRHFLNGDRVQRSLSQQ